MTRWQESFPWTATTLGFLWPARPARRKRWLVIAAGALAVVGVHATATAVLAAKASKAAERFTERWGALDAVRQRPPAVEDARNRARAVRAAAEIMALPPRWVGAAAKSFENFATGEEGSPSAQDREALRRIVAENSVALSLLDVASSRPETNWNLPYEKGFDMEVPPTLQILKLAKLNAAAGRLACEEGRADEAIAAVRRGSAIAASLESEPVAIVQIVRLAIGRVNAALVRRILGTADLRSDQAAALQGAIAPMEPRRALQRALVVETAVIDPMFRGRRQEPLEFLARSPLERGLAFGAIRTIARPVLLDDARIWLDTMAGTIASLDAPRYARGDSSRSAPRIRFWNGLVGSSLRFMGSEVVDRGDLAEVREALERIAIAVERHRLETGRTPSALAGLAPVYLPSVPIDPFTGSAFRYETDGAAWWVASDGDWRSIEYTRQFDPILEWSRTRVREIGLASGSAS